MQESSKSIERSVEGEVIGFSLKGKNDAPKSRCSKIPSNDRCCIAAVVSRKDIFLQSGGLHLWQQLRVITLGEESRKQWNIIPFIRSAGTAVSAYL